MSQFTKYSSADFSAPTLNGFPGSLLTVLDAVLVTGYGSQVPAGWDRPFNSSGSIAMYRQAGTGVTLLVNDNSPNATSTSKEAWATGWETVIGITSPVGTGAGQFPTPAQLLTTGHTVIRKSTAVSAATRQWQIFADGQTFYMFIASGDTAGQYFEFGFGDMYTFAPADVYNNIIMGRSAENSVTAATNGFDLFSAINAAVVGNFMARSYTNGAGSITVGKHGDGVKGSATTYLGAVQYPNAEDTEVYLSPVWVTENSSSNIRGLLRGLYQPLHTIANFTDGQTFIGTGSYTGKTYQVIKQTPNAGAVFVETSNTLLTN